MDPRAEKQLEVGGEAVTLKLGFNAIARFEQVSGVGFDEVITRLGNNRMRFGDALQIIWAAGPKSLTEEQVGDALDDLGIRNALALAGELIASSLGVADDAEGGAEPEGKPEAAKAKRAS